MSTTDADSGREEGNEMRRQVHRPYSPPRLVDYGDVGQLTAGASGGMADQNLDMNPEP